MNYKTYILQVTKIFCYLCFQSMIAMLFFKVNDCHLLCHVLMVRLMLGVLVSMAKTSTTVTFPLHCTFCTLSLYRANNGTINFRMQYTGM